MDCFHSHFDKETENGRTGATELRGAPQRVRCWGSSHGWGLGVWRAVPRYGPEGRSGQGTRQGASGWAGLEETHFQDERGLGSHPCSAVSLAGWSWKPLPILCLNAQVYKRGFSPALNCKSLSPLITKPQNSLWREQTEFLMGLRKVMFPVREVRKHTICSLSAFLSHLVGSRGQGDLFHYCLAQYPPQGRPSKNKSWMNMSKLIKRQLL